MEPKFYSFEYKKNSWIFVLSELFDFNWMVNVKTIVGKPAYLSQQVACLKKSLLQNMQIKLFKIGILGKTQCHQGNVNT